jgi:hypothetical protein
LAPQVELDRLKKWYYGPRADRLKSEGDLAQLLLHFAEAMDRKPVNPADLPPDAKPEEELLGARRDLLYTELCQAYPEHRWQIHTRRSKMNKRLRPIAAGLLGLVSFTLCAAIEASAQTPAVKPKPPMFSYVADWQFPRSSWPDVEKTTSALNPILDKALADGTIIGYGVDKNLVHQPDTATHDDWWSAMSLAGIVKTLDQISATETNTSPLMASATKHWDSIYVSRYYNWKPGSFKGAYTFVTAHKLKESEPFDGLDAVAQNLLVPLLEKQLADGVILAYEIDTQVIHTQAPGTFWIVYITPTPEGLDTVHRAIRESMNANPLAKEAFGGIIDDTGHRDGLDKSDGIYK